MLLAGPKLALEANSTAAPLPVAGVGTENNAGPVPLSVEGLSVLISDIFFVLTLTGVSDTLDFSAGSLGRRYDLVPPSGGES